jgi:hypothetical protein
MFKSVPLNGGTALIFTPGYVMHYNPRGNLIKLYPYSNVSISTYISSEIVNGAKQPSDEIEHIGYRYETKDGRRDMRYSYENNPSYTFVYRGSATIRCGQFTYEQKFSNKSLTAAFEKSLKDYLTLMTGKYREAADCVLSNDTDFIGAESVSVFMMRKATAEKLRIAAEKAEAEKREKERLEREAAAETKRREQRQVEEARAREERKKQDLLRNLTIVDGVLTNWYGSEKHLVLPVGMITSIGTAFRWKPSLETVEIPEGVSEEFLELCSVVIISQFILEDKRIHEVLKRMPNVEYINITNTTRGRGSQPLCTSTTGDKKYKTSWGDTYELLTMDEIEKLILKQFKGYTLRGRIKVVDVKTTGPEINEIWTEFSKLRNKYNVGNEFGIEGYIQTKYGE